MDALIKSLRPNKPADAKPGELDPSEFMAAAVRADQPRPSRAEAEEAVKTLLAYIGENTGREGLLDTPRRVVEAYDELYQGYHQCPAEVLNRDVTQPYEPSEAVEAAWLEVYRDTERWWPLYQLAEKLVDLDDALLTWRHKHVVTVERIIGRRRGTGGTEGVAYLASTLTRRCFPELWSLRTKL